jgi:hypothetical protein
MKSRNHGNDSDMEKPIHFLAKVAAMILTACVWVAILGDQMPCFLGVPFCD